MTTRIFAGAMLSLVIALVARRARSLSTSGAAAAVVIGTLAVAAGWSWGVLLILYFASSTLLSKIGKAEKERRTASVVEKGGERDAWQVLANGVVFAIAAVGALASPSRLWLALGAGALAASASDTWATEIGTLYGGTPRSILTFRPIAPGTSGGVSIAGIVASVAGAAFVAIIATFGGAAALPVAIGGIAGSLLDSLVGATIQSRRWCDTCRLETERRTHSCGAPTRPLRGATLVDNDVVNFVSALGGGLLATQLAR